MDKFIAGMIVGAIIACVLLVFFDSVSEEDELEPTEDTKPTEEKNERKRDLAFMNMLNYDGTKDSQREIE